jgi:hypothetical protein
MSDCPLTAHDSKGQTTVILDPLFSMGNSINDRIFLDSVGKESNEFEKEITTTIPIIYIKDLGN